MKTRFIAILLVLVNFQLVSQSVKLNGHVINGEGSVQIMQLDTPFDDNVVILADLPLDKDGKFVFEHELESEDIYLFRINDQTTRLILYPDSELHIELTVEALEKADWFGNTSKMTLTKFQSNNVMQMKLYNTQKSIDKLNNEHRKSNGKLPAKSAGLLLDHLKKLSVSEDLEFRTALANSRWFLADISYLKLRLSSKEIQPLIDFHNNHFELNNLGIYAIQYYPINDIRLQFFTKNPKKLSYFDFILSKINSYSNPMLKKTLELSLITNAQGMKWVSQNLAKEKLATFIETSNHPLLLKNALKIQSIYETSLIGKPIKNFSFPTPEGVEIQISDYKGEYLLLDFWATWCGPCIKSMRKLPALKISLEDKLNILCITDETDAAKINKFIKRNNYKNKLGFALNPNKEEVDKYFTKRAIPLYYLINPEGIIIDKAVGDPTAIIKKHLK